MQTASWPELREELTLQPGPSSHDGSPTWTLHDPLANQFFRLSWPVFEILSRWHLADPQAIAQAVDQETTLGTDVDDVLEIAEFLARRQLLKPQTARDNARLLAIHDAQKTGWLTWALHHYLFFRLPLLRPDALLNRLYPHLAWLGGGLFRGATVLALLVGVLLIGRQWDAFTTTFVDHFSIGGLMSFGIALGLAKIIHELGHALVAKHYGLRVPTIGVAFLVLMPVLYTDVNEAWTLTERRQRLLIGGAGILSELTLAAWASLAWGLLPDGTAKSMAFTLAATTWISSLAINLSPFMRFDGYFLAMDALDMPNLHNRAFALARWHLREVLFKLGEAVPEILPPRTHLGLILFAWCVWIYRLTLFLGIALLVYHFFIKAVGIVLFGVEMGWFVMRPFVMEFQEWQQRRQAIIATRRGRISLALVVLGLLIIIVPWNGRVTAPAMLKASQHSVLYAPAAAILGEIRVKNGDIVQAGQVLAQLENPDLVIRRQQLERRQAVLRYELSSMGFEDSFRSRAQSIAEELSAAMAERAAIEQEISRLTLVSPMNGVVGDVSVLAQPGQWINPKEALLSVGQGALVEAYIAEDDYPRLHRGDRATFIPDGSGSRLPATIESIDPVATKALNDPALTTAYGGPISARFDNKTLTPDSAIYRIRLSVADAPVSVPVRGMAHLEGARQSLAGHALTSAAAVLIREWGM